MIWRRYQVGLRRWSALAAVLSALGGSGCMVTWSSHRVPAGEKDRAPETPAGPRAANTGAGRAGGSVPLTGCSTAALQLIQEVNAYRAENGLRAIPASRSLCTVAAAHTRDLAEHAPHAGARCNLHSWSARSGGTPCCYTRDHAQAACMWDKPRELTEYRGNGYENAASGITSPEGALRSWRSSPEHNAVILNRGRWRSRSWQAIGADLHEGVAFLWFGEEPDPAQ